MTIIDTHTHFYDPTRPEGVPWPPRDDAVLYRRVTPSEFCDVAGACGVTGTVVIEASAWAEDNQWLLDLAKTEPAILGVIGRLDPDDPQFMAHLERFSADALFRGLRLSLRGTSPSKSPLLLRYRFVNRRVRKRLIFNEKGLRRIRGEGDADGAVRAVGFIKLDAFIAP